MSDPRTQKTGRGLLRPFKREHSDFASGTGAKLLISNAKGVLGVKRGEYRHRGDFGSRLIEMLHSAPRGLEADAAAIHAAMDIERWEPRITVQTEGTTFEQTSTPGLRMLRISIGETEEAGDVRTGEFEGAYHEVIA